VVIWYYRRHVRFIHLALVKEEEIKHNDTTFINPLFLLTVFISLSLAVHAILQKYKQTEERRHRSTATCHARAVENKKLAGRASHIECTN
jgi:hypothetical protein